MEFKTKLFGNKMEQVGLDELYKEKVKLERMERQTLFDIKRLTDEKRRSFERGFTVTSQEKKSIARKINLTEQRIKLKVAQADRASQALEALEQIIFIKENSQKFEDSGVLSLMSRTSQSDMDKFLSSVSLKDAVETGKLDTVRRTMEEEFGLLPDEELDPDTIQLMEIWDQGDPAMVQQEFDKWKSDKDAEGPLRTSD